LLFLPLLLFFAVAALHVPALRRFVSVLNRRVRS